MIKPAHYRKPPEMKPRYRRDHPEVSSYVSVISVRGRGSPVELLSPGERLASPALVSSAFETFDRILLTLPNYVFQNSAYFNVYTDLLQKLSPNLHYVILVQQTGRPTLDQWIETYHLAERVTVVETPDYFRFTIWAEDGYAVCQGSGAGRSVFVEPASFARAQDGLVADVVSAATDIGTYNTNLYFQGGNLLIGDDFWFLGVDYANYSFDLGYIEQQPDESRLEATRRAFGANLDHRRTLYTIASNLPVPEATRRQFTLDGQPWTEILYAGNSPGTSQPLFHIDLFLTLAGRDSESRAIVLVGDPAMADQILGRETEPHAMAPIFDDIADSLSALGFRVIRNPLPLVYEDDPVNRRRSWYFATSNNALVEVGGDIRNVWLPTYAYGAWRELQATDEANQRIWQELGFQVTMLADFHPFASFQGAVHCIKKYINRS